MKRAIVVAGAVVAVIAGIVLITTDGDSDEVGDAKATRLLLGQVRPNLVDDPRRAALTALAADRFHSGSGSAFAMLDVAVAHTSADRIIAAHDGPVSAAIRTGRQVLTAGTDLKLRVWDSESGARLGERGVKRPIEYLAASSTVGAVGSVDADGAVTLWEVGDPRAPSPRELKRKGTAPVVGIAFNATGTELLVIGRDGRIDRFDSAVGRRLPTLDIADVDGRLPWRGTRKVELEAGWISRRPGL